MGMSWVYSVVVCPCEDLITASYISIQNVGGDGRKTVIISGPICLCQY